MRTPRTRSDAWRRGDAPPAGRSRRLGVIMGAGAAALVSAGLVYWISASDDNSLSTPPPPAQPGAAAPAPKAYAPARPDAGQVVRAYEQLQETYADQGTEGVMSFARACVDSLRADPGVLDFCLAFDIYAGALQEDDESARAWQAQAGARDLAMAQAVLPPGADAAARLAAVRALARQASLETPQPAAPVAPATGRAAPGTEAGARPAAASCRLKATAAQRTICASPALRNADRRLRLTYRRALAAGLSPKRLAHDQARFRASVDAAGADRAAIARLYHRRTQALEQVIRKTAPAR